MNPNEMLSVLPSPSEAIEYTRNHWQLGVAAAIGGLVTRFFSGFGARKRMQGMYNAGFYRGYNNGFGSGSMAGEGGYSDPEDIEKIYRSGLR